MISHAMVTHLPLRKESESNLEEHQQDPPVTHTVDGMEDDVAGIKEHTEVVYLERGESEVGLSKETATADMGSLEGPYAFPHSAAPPFHEFSNLEL